MPILTINHKTEYRYAHPVAFGEHRIMLRPLPGHDLRIVAHRLAIEPEPMRLRWIHDVFGNSVAIATFDERADTLTFTSTATVELSPAEEFALTPDDPAFFYPFLYDYEEYPDLVQFVTPQYADPDGELSAWAMQFLDEQYNVLEDPFIEQLLCHEDTRQLVYRRGPLLFVYNFHPTQSYTDLRIPVPDARDYRVILNSDSDVTEKIPKEELEEFFILSDLTIQQAKEAGASVTKTPYGKCARCWRHRPTVGTSKAHPDLCDRCESVVIAMSRTTPKTIQ